MNENLQTPIAIVVAGILIAIAILFSGGSTSSGNQVERTHDETFGNNNSESALNVLPIEEIDHVFGDSGAEVVLIEYSDFECPFCSRAHPTFERVIEEYNGKVAWVYRHFPLTNIHSRAERAAVASECVAELAGNDAFWRFTSNLFEGQRNLGDDFYTAEALKLGISNQEFSECMSSGRHEVKVSRDMQNAVYSGGRGTPFTIVVNEKGEVFPFAGALPYEQIKSIVDNALAS